MLKQVLFGACMLVGVSSVHASWLVGKGPDNVSVAKVAKTTNELGDVLYMWRNSQAVKLVAALQLAGDKNFSNKTPGYQIDQGTIIKLNRIPLEPFRSKEGWLQVSSQMATWLLYEGERLVIGQGEPFYDWLVGERVRFIYFDQNGHEKTTEFSLEGISRALTRATGIRPE